jgi:hypothetical protein
MEATSDQVATSRRSAKVTGNPCFRYSLRSVYFTNALRTVPRSVLHPDLIEVRVFNLQQLDPKRAVLAGIADALFLVEFIAGQLPVLQHSNGVARPMPFGWYVGSNIALCFLNLGMRYTKFAQDSKRLLRDDKPAIRHQAKIILTLHTLDLEP